MRADRFSWGKPGLLFCSFVLGAVGCAPNDAPSPARADETAPSAAAPTADAHALLQDLRARFEPAASPIEPDVGSAIAAARFQPALLPPSDATAFDVAGGRLRPRLAASVARHADAALPASSGDAASVRALDQDGRAQMSLSFRLAAAAARDAETADGYATYRGVLPAATLLSRASGDGVEDYVYFEKAPAASEVRYDVELSEDVAGLRLVGGSLEALDASGTPRLRVAPPFLIDAARARTDATLAVEGCAADTNPAAPWDRPVTAPGARRCTVVIAWDGSAVRYPALLDPSWSTTGSMASARAYHTATYIPSTAKILVVGGIGTAGTPIATAELYNQTSGTWAATDSVPTTGTGRAYHTAVVLNDGTVFVAGGYRDGTNVTNTSAIYTPSTGHWTNKAQLTTARGRHAATVLTTGEVVVTGGLSGSTTITAVEVYRPTGANANTWFQANSPTSARRASHQSVRMQSGDVMIIGGRDGTTTLDTVYSYNLAANAWTARGTLSAARVGHTATIMSNGYVLVAGGGPYNSTTVYATCDLYNPTTNLWKPTADMISARTGHAATLNWDDSIIVSGGIGPGSSALAIKGAERFKSAFETWMEEPSLLTARAFHTATPTPSSGTIIAAGGITKTSSPTYLASAEKVTPAFTSSFASDYFDGTHATWGPSDLPEVNPSDDPNASTRWTELKGTMYYPTIGSGKYPVVVFLHGNHASCGHGSNPHIDDNSQYSGSTVDPGGTCPSGYSEVRSDKGFAYVAHELAQKGYIVFSIDANKGIANRDDGAGQFGLGQLIDNRGRLVLKTLQHMSQWNSGARATPSGLPNLVGHLDMHNVGLVGHSRGGEGVRAARRFFADDPAWQSAIPDLYIAGVFEIGSTDQVYYTRQIDYDDGNTPWALLMGTCDSNARYSGEDTPYRSGWDVFDRMIQNSVTFVGEYAVWGANHNFYNSEWQTTDVNAADCKPTPIYEQGGAGSGITGSARQRQTAVYTITHFMQGWVGTSANQANLSIFDPVTTPPPAIPVERAHQMGEGSRLQLEDFHLPFGQSSFGFDTTASGAVTVVQDASESITDVIGAHEGGNTGAYITWTSASSGNKFQVNWSGPGGGYDFSFDTYFELRLDRDPTNTASAPTNFSVKLVNGSGTTSNAVQIANYTTTSNAGPSGMQNSSDFTRPFPLGAVKIPLSAFGGATLSSIRGVQFVFDQSSSGTILMTNLRMKSD
ncbi:MAG TPA: kelch repeat-containing protein [Polyangia bacterium]|nr:kelch repeat-containing protein [Polyangia bacterium]